jgi:hypothetical protein
MKRVRAKITIEELLSKLKKVIEKGGETTIDWGKDDVYLVLGVTYYKEDPAGKVKFTVSIYDSTSEEMQQLYEKYFEKVELATKNAEEGGVYASDEGTMTSFYFRGSIYVKVIKMPDIGTTFIIAVAR